MRTVWGWVSQRPWLAVLVISAGGNFMAWRALEAEADTRVDAIEDERHDRCVDSRTDLHATLLAIANELTSMTETERDELERVLDESLPVADC